VDDVVGIPPQVVLTLPGGDDVVGRRHELLERPGDRLVVALGAERLDHGHFADPSIRVRT
jgi:hypothetical protein